MFERLRSTPRTEEGFTLIEMMIVLSMIALLAVAAAPLVMLQKQNALRADVESDVKEAVRATVAYFENHPDSEAILANTPACEGGIVRVPELSFIVSNNTTCVSVWGTPDEFYVRGSSTIITGEYLYTSTEQSYARTGQFDKMSGGEDE